MALDPPAQAVTGQVQAPLKPWEIEMRAAAMFEMVMGMKKGLMWS